MGAVACLCAGGGLFLDLLVAVPQGLAPNLAAGSACLCSGACGVCDRVAKRGDGLSLLFAAGGACSVLRALFSAGGFFGDLPFAPRVTGCFGDGARGYFGADAAYAAFLLVCGTGKLLRGLPAAPAVRKLIDDGLVLGFAAAYAFLVRAITLGTAGGSLRFHLFVAVDAAVAKEREVDGTAVVALCAFPRASGNRAFVLVLACVFCGCAVGDEPVPSVAFRVIAFLADSVAFVAAVGFEGGTVA